MAGRDNSVFRRPVESQNYVGQAIQSIDNLLSRLHCDFKKNRVLQTVLRIFHVKMHISSIEFRVCSMKETEAFSFEKIGKISDLLPSASRRMDRFSAAPKKKLLNYS